MEISFDFKENTQYYMVVEHDWAPGTEKKTMTISCTDGNEKMEFKEQTN